MPQDHNEARSDPSGREFDAPDLCGGSDVPGDPDDEEVAQALVEDQLARGRRRQADPQRQRLSVIADSAAGVGASRAEPTGRGWGPTILRGPELVRLDCPVFDIQGRDVTERKRTLAPGVYFAHLAAEGFRQSRKLTVLR